MRSRVLAEVVALFAPPGCAACRTTLRDAREVVCGDCRRALRWLRGPRCPRCALPVPCAPCPARRAAYERAFSPVAYDGPARALVRALKFGGALAVADLMAAQIAAAAPVGLLAVAPGFPGAPRGSGTEPARAFTLVPVPSHPANVRTRGFDQAQHLAASLGRRTGLPVARCLRRAGAPGPQLGLTLRRRTEPGRIGVRATGPAPTAAILVDDVHTTGATLDGCARALRAAGARHVLAVTYARTLRTG